MSQSRLTDEEIQKLIECIESGADVPEDILPKLSPSFFEKLRAAGKFDYKELDRYRIPTLEYAGKRSESVILAQAAITGGAAPLQIVRSFANGKNGDWKNLIVQGDNLQFLKTCYMNQDQLIKDKVKGKVKLIYIDPPFATKSDFGGDDGVKSYSDKITSAEFIENLRERLIYLHELLANDGCICLHLDQKMNQYFKVIMDEIFGKDRLKNEIIWYYWNKFQMRDMGSYPKNHETIYVFSKTKNYTFNPQAQPLDRPKKLKRIYWDAEKGRIQNIKGDDGKVVYKDVYDEKVDDVWDIPYLGTTSKERLEYPTQKSEELLSRIVASYSDKGDLVIDCFAGSGTTAAVAEKLNRRWIMCDFGKHAIYTMQKRLLNITDSKKLENGNKPEKYDQPPKPFCVVSAGAYDFSKIMNLRENKDVYVSFVLGLFGIIQGDTDFLKKFKFPNIFAEKDGDPVEVYPIWQDEYLKDIRVDEEYLQGIINASKGNLKGDYYIITPETCTVIGNTSLKNNNKEDVNFHLLKFPYKVLEDVSRQFQIEEQPSSIEDINKLISSTGFYFNEEVSIKIKRQREGFKIEHFSTKILNSKKELFTGIDGLAMILVDVDYDGKIFDMDEVVYGKDIGDDGLVKITGLSDKTVIIAVDKHGNESKITKV